ncbi:transposase [Planctomycetaceae bacterium SH139]
MNTSNFSFQAFDPDAEVQVSERNLPHWFQPGVALFLTFRTLDSLPREVIVRNERQLAEWLIAHDLPISLASWDSSFVSQADQRQLDKLSPADGKHFRILKDKMFHRTLDQCHGKCVLQQPELAKIVATALLHYHEQAYDLDSFVIMPNHVHAIAQIRTGYDLSIVGQSWMRYTARLINKQLNCSGGFWQPEAFDHLIRSDSQFWYLRKYTAANPEASRLNPGQYLYWSSK